MRLERQGMWALALAGCSMSVACVGGMSLKAQVPDAPAPQQQPVPDAPVPQTLPKLNTITPVGPAIPDAPPPPAGAAPAPTAAPAETPAQIQDDGPAPAAHPSSSIIVNVTYVNVPFTVKDSKGHLVPGLTYRDVRIFENGLRQQPKLFTVDPYPLSVALVIDQSVTFDTMEKINDSLSALQGAFSPYDEIAVFTYNNGVTKQTGFTAAQSARLGVVLDRSKGKGREPLMPLGGPLANAGTINNKDIDPNFNRQNQNGMQLNPPKEYHTLNDAILAAGREVSGAAKGRRRVVYVISDGKEFGSKAKEKDVIKYLQTNDIAVYGTLVGDASIPGLGFLDRVHLPLTMRDDVLPRYAATTGGEVDPEFRPKGIEQSFARLAETVRTQYTIGYYTHESPFNEKFRKIEVRVLKPGLTVIAKDGYYPSATDSRPAPVTPSATP